MEIESLRTCPDNKLLSQQLGAGLRYGVGLHMDVPEYKLAFVADKKTEEKEYRVSPLNMYHDQIYFEDPDLQVGIEEMFSFDELLQIAQGNFPESEEQQLISLVLNKL